MLVRKSSLLLSALLLPPCPGDAFSPPLASRAPATLRPAQLAAIPLRMEEDKKVQIAKDDKAPAEEEDSLYSSFDFEFDVRSCRYASRTTSAHLCSCCACRPRPSRRFSVPPSHSSSSCWATCDRVRRSFMSNNEYTNNNYRLPAMAAIIYTLSPRARSAPHTERAPRNMRAGSPQAALPHTPRATQYTETERCKEMHTPTAARERRDGGVGDSRLKAPKGRAASGVPSAREREGLRRLLAPPRRANRSWRTP